KLDYLKRYLNFEYGAPSDDTLRRFFRALDPESFESCFMKWIESLQLDLAGKVVAIDGKTSRCSFDKNSRPMHMVSAFVSELGLSLGQVKTAEKSNEITAIPELLELLDIAGAIVTIDAMGCQSKITDKIIDKEADYLISLKGNQGTLNDDVRLAFEQKTKSISYSSFEDVDKGHGRIETRCCTVTNDIDWLKERHPQWKNLNSIVEIESHRDIGGEVSTEKRYYISSLTTTPEVLLQTTRQHWGIENNLHWVLDVCFNEDKSRIRKENAPRNMGIIKKTVLNLFQSVKRANPRMSLKRIRKLAGW
ncbi:ISAs1 family transposase, partial [Corynebacterium parakroppenstedtii]|uniref:ISAs1 family transposase n=1 Tax=Corynebacterium parakroppenstedtii TaxID=2828363 RepID=UPI001EFFB4BF